jgi:hypothetical protein
MPFARIRTEAKRPLDGGLRPRQTRRRAIEAIKVNPVVYPGELAIRLEKGRVMLNSLIQQMVRV